MDNDEEIIIGVDATNNCLGGPLVILNFLVHTCVRLVVASIDS